MPSITVAAIKRISLAAQRQLAEHGWRRKAPHLFREFGTVIHGIHFQASQFGEADSGTFTINLVVTEPTLYRAWMGRPLPGNPVTALFPVQTRIGRIMSNPRDHWWEVKPDTDLAALEVEVVDFLQQARAEFFPHFESLEDMLARLRSVGSLPGLHGGQHALMHGLLAAMLGFTPESEKVFRTLISMSTVSGFTDRVRAAAGHVGVTV